MANRCAQCEFYDFDYEWDGEDDEYEVDICLIHHDEYLESDVYCPYFKKFKPRPYVEQDTDCDKCEFLHKCIVEGNVLESTTTEDMRQHYIGGIRCKRTMIT